MGIAGTLCVMYAQPVLLVSAFADVLLNWWRKCLGSLSGIPPIIWEKYMYPEILSFFELLRCVHTYVHTYIHTVYACVCGDCTHETHCSIQRHVYHDTIQLLEHCSLCIVSLGGSALTWYITFCATYCTY